MPKSGFKVVCAAPRMEHSQAVWRASFPQQGILLWAAQGILLLCQAVGWVETQFGLILSGSPVISAVWVRRLGARAPGQRQKLAHRHASTQFIICNEKIIIFDTQFIVFDTQFLVFNTKFIVFTHWLAFSNSTLYS